jgi:hypothetical protein
MIKQHYKLLLTLLCLSLLQGCSSNVVVKGVVPTPVTERYPVKVSLVIDENLRKFTLHDKREKKITLAIGEAQIGMFTTVTHALFSSVTVSDNVDSSGNTALSIYPTIEEVQLATPFDNQFKVFEVWLRYTVSLFDNKGTLLNDWQLTAYGKTPTRFLGSDEDALNQATMMALRDAGARLTLELPRLPEFVQLLDKLALVSTVTGETHHGS